MYNPSSFFDKTLVLPTHVTSFDLANSFYSFFIEQISNFRLSFPSPSGRNVGMSVTLADSFNLVIAVAWTIATHSFIAYQPNN